eukprot:3742056-Ditylum_brightwellii.AAC.1
MELVVFFCTWEKVLVPNNFNTPFMCPYAMMIILNLSILEFPGIFLSMTPMAVCHLLGVNPNKKGNAIIVARTCQMSMLSKTALQCL